MGLLIRNIMLHNAREYFITRAAFTKIIDPPILFIPFIFIYPNFSFLLFTLSCQIPVSEWDLPHNAWTNL